MKNCEAYSFCFFLIFYLVVHETRASLGENKINVTGERGGYDTAVKYCNKNGLKLVRINNDSDNILVYDLASKIKVGRYWIDGKRNTSDNAWVNSDNARLNYTKWDRVEPNNKGGSENCVEGNFYSNEYWNDVDCNVPNGIICYDDSVTKTKSITFKDMRTKGTYDEAVKKCKDIGGTLPRPDSAEMSAKIKEFVKGWNAYWIDVTKDGKTGKWTYSDGTEATYNDFQPGGSGSGSCATIGSTGWFKAPCSYYYDVICAV